MNIPSVTKCGCTAICVWSTFSSKLRQIGACLDASLGGDLQAGCIFRGRELTPSSLTQLTKAPSQLYQRGILLVDQESKARIQRFYRRDDACRMYSQPYLESRQGRLPGTLISRLLPRMLLKERGISTSAMTFASTKAGKPYIAS